MFVLQTRTICRPLHLSNPLFVCVPQALEHPSCGPISLSLTFSLSIFSLFSQTSLCWSVRRPGTLSLSPRAVGASFKMSGTWIFVLQETQPLLLSLYSSVWLFLSSFFVLFVLYHNQMENVMSYRTLISRIDLGLNLMGTNTHLMKV